MSRAKDLATMIFRCSAGYHRKAPACEHGALTRQGRLCSDGRVAGVMKTIAARVCGGVLAAAMIASCNGDDVGNCAAVYPQGQWCWERVTRNSCDLHDGQFSSKSCFELGYGCPDVQQFEAPEVCTQRCGDANLHLASCGITAFIDCSGSAPLGYTSCVTACARTKACEELQSDPLAVCNAFCAEFDAGLPDRP